MQPPRMSPPITARRHGMTAARRWLSCHTAVRDARGRSSCSSRSPTHARAAAQETADALRAARRIARLRPRSRRRRSPCCAAASRSRPTIRAPIARWPTCFGSTCCSSAARSPSIIISARSRTRRSTSSSRRRSSTPSSGARSRGPSSSPTARSSPVPADAQAHYDLGRRGRPAGVLRRDGRRPAAGRFPRRAPRLRRARARADPRPRPAPTPG